MQLGVSVIICCFNSAERLPDTLKHLALQQVPGNIPWEVIVIDNASTDNTTQIALTEWQQYNKLAIEFKVLPEPTPGLRFAREKGLRHARYEYLLYCDDDNWLSATYLATAFDIMFADKNIGVLGGCGIFEPEQPAWTGIGKYKSNYVNGMQEAVAIARHWVYGAAAVYKRSVLLDLYEKGWQQITTGRTGNQLSSGEDVEICFMYFLCGYKIMANDQLIFNHFVPAQRQNANYVINMSYWLSYTDILLNGYYAIVYNDDTPFENSMNARYLAAAKALLKQKLLLWGKQLKTCSPLSTEDKIAFQATFGKFISLYKNRKKVIKHHYHIKNLIDGIKLT